MVKALKMPRYHMNGNETMQHVLVPAFWSFSDVLFFLTVHVILSPIITNMVRSYALWQNMVNTFVPYGITKHVIYLVT